MKLSQRKSGDEESEEKTDGRLEKTPASAGDPVAVVAMGSVLLSWYHFYVKGDAETGIFVGLWAPTLLTASNYFQQKDIIRRVREGLSSF